MDGNDVKLLFAANLKRLRSERGLSQLKLATQIGMATNFINDIEQGRKGISTDSIARLAEALEVDPYELFLPEENLPSETRKLFVRYSEDLARETGAAIAAVQKRYSRLVH